MGKIIGRIFPESPAGSAPAALDTAAPVPEKLRCELCGKEYKTAKGLAEHMAKEHPLDILPGEDLPGEDPSGEGGT